MNAFIQWPWATFADVMCKDCRQNTQLRYSVAMTDPEGKLNGWRCEHCDSLCDAEPD